MSCLCHNSCRRLRALDYLKGPVRFLHELYARYPNGGHEGDVALVTRARGDEAGWAYWDTASRRWRLMSGGGGGDYIEVSPMELEFPVDGGEFTLTIESNTNYTIMADNWLNLSTSSGTGSGSVSVTAGANAEGARSGSVVFTSSGGDTRMVTVLQAAKNYTLSFGAVDPIGGGTMDTSVAGSYAYGSTVSLVATASAHYGFTRWEKQNGASWDVLGTTATYSLTVTGTTVARSVFARTEYQVTTAVDDPAKGSVSAGGWVAAGGSIELTATPVTGNVFVEWNDGNVQNPRTVTNIQADVTFTALFDAGTLEVSPTSLSFTAEGDTQSVGVISDISWTAAVNYD